MAHLKKIDNLPSGGYLPIKFNFKNTFHRASRWVRMFYAKVPESYFADEMINFKWSKSQFLLDQIIVVSASLIDWPVIWKIN